jgi:hypothetical protein
MRVHITLTDNIGNTYEGIAELTKVTAKAGAAKKPAQTQKGAKKAPQVIHELYQKEYFREEKHLDVVVRKLGQMRYNFDKDTVRKALDRAEYLTNKGSRTYIEKYPPS